MRGTLAVGLLGLACTIVPARAQAPGQVVLMAYPGIFQDNYVDTVTRPFAQASGTAVQYFPTTNSAQMLGTLRTQKGDPQVDVVIMDTTTAAAACAEGLVEPLTEAEMPVLKDVHPIARQAGGECGPGVTFDHFVMTWNTQTVQTPPTAWRDLWNPAYRGRISLSSPPDIQGLVLTAVLAHAETGDWRNVNSTFQKLREIAPLVQTFNPQPDSYTLVLNDQVGFATGWNARAQYYRDQSNGRLGVLLPAEGTGFQINTINVVKGSKNRAAAMAFVTYALSPEAQAAFTNRMFYAPTNTQARPSAEALGRTAAAPESMSKVVAIDWAEMVKLRESWNQRWRREVIAAGGR
jgi:putative spermidine/putrescine transport system substrate-binding protein